MLALALGKHLHEIESLPASEVNRWMNFYAQEPFGLVRDDLRCGIIGAAVTQPHLKKGKTARPADFMPRFRSRYRPQSRSELTANTNALIAWLESKGNGSGSKS